MPFNAARSLAGFAIRVGPFQILLCWLSGRVAVLTGAAAAAAEAAGERFVLEFQVAAGVWQREPLMACSGTRFEDVLPVRPFRFGKGLRSFAGWWYFATTGTHVGFESWLERDHLMLMDFALEVLVLCKGLCFSLRAVDLAEDLVGGLDPGERSRVLVPGIDECADHGGELFDGAE